MPIKKYNFGIQRIRGFFYENALYKFTFDIDIYIFEKQIFWWFSRS